ncbi:unnamed protein product [Sphenostylis stenocarpa]|uniref:Uncharacterized protein n=1 Tax=Sphenostylis stenocarpa TaxID=92480 RepID=A0AA86S2Z8_9FABA|nr:unnamed protein product [Sphenostylis stenocarpa]
MHQAHTSLLWAKPEPDTMGEEVTSGGEFEIERMSNCIIEASSKDLLLLSWRTSSKDIKKDEELSWHHSLRPSGNGRVSSKTDGDTDSECKSGNAGTEWYNHVVPSETLSFNEPDAPQGG